MEVCCTKSGTSYGYLGKKCNDRCDENWADPRYIFKIQSTGCIHWLEEMYEKETVVDDYVKNLFSACIKLNCYFII